MKVCHWHLLSWTLLTLAFLYLTSTPSHTSTFTASNQPSRHKMSDAEDLTRNLREGDADVAAGSTTKETKERRTQRDSTHRYPDSGAPAPSSLPYNGFAPYSSNWVPTDPLNQADIDLLLVNVGTYDYKQAAPHPGADLGIGPATSPATVSNHTNLPMDYCCSYNPDGPGSRYYGYYLAQPEQGYRTVVLTLWPDFHKESGTIGFSIAPLFPCEKRTMESKDAAGNGITENTVDHHDWDNAERRDEAFGAANRLLHELHSDLSLYKRLVQGTAKKAMRQDTNQLVMTLNHLSKKKKLHTFTLGPDKCSLRFYNGTKHPSKWTPIERLDNGRDPRIALSGRSSIQRTQKETLQKLLNQDHARLTPPSDCPTGRIGNVYIYHFSGATVANQLRWCSNRCSLNAL